VAIMSSRTATLTEGGLPPMAALNGGIQVAFGVAAVISVGAVVLACFIRNTKPPVEEQSMVYQPGTAEEQSMVYQPGTAEEPVSEESATKLS
jgi:hypothetical protein